MPVPIRRPLRRSAQHDWRPLTGVELQWLGQVLAHCGIGGRGPGRPAGYDALERMEACLEVCARRLPWHEAVTDTAPGMRPDTLRRCFLRWARRGVFKEMLRVIRFAGAPGPAMEWFACLAYRRAWRAQGIAGVVLARRLGFASALRAPPAWMPDPELSARCVSLPFPAPADGRGHPPAVVAAVMRWLNETLRIAYGLWRIPRAARAGW